MRAERNGGSLQEGFRDRRSQRARLVLFAGALLLCLAVLLDLGMGEAYVQSRVPPDIVARILAHHLPWIGRHIPIPQWAIDTNADVIVWVVRLPRVVTGALIGMLLALAGAAYQSLLQNPLADPYSVGVASGSALGSVGILLLGGGLWLNGMAQPLAAFVCGLAAVALVYRLASVNGRISAQTFLLAGTMIGTFFWSLIPLIITLANHEGNSLRDRILSTLFGSLEDMGWDRVALLLPFGLLGALTLWRSRDELDIMAAGEESAIHQGVDTRRFLRRIVIAGTLMTAASVAVAGIIAFVGFVVPHIARQLVGPVHRYLLPTTLLFGATLLVTADWLSRTFLNHIEVGIVTSLLGAPVFCTMLRRQLAGTSP